MLKLHVFPPSPRSFKVIALANHLRLEHELAVVDLLKGEHLSPAYAALNPNKRAPVLEEDGFVLWESNAILQYLASSRPESGLLPEEPRRRADVTRWQCWDLAHWDPACAILIYEHILKAAMRRGEPDPGEIARGEERFRRCAAILDRHLAGRRFVAGDTLTVADFSLAPALNVSARAQLPVADYKEIKRWHAGLCELPAWRSTLEASRLPV